VGSGTDDPSRRSLAALQWQGTEELQQVTVRGRPVTINGSATPVPLRRGLEASVAAVEEPAWTADLGPGGPVPSSVVDGLSADGLVQRRRRRPVDLGTAVPPQTDPASAPRAVPRNSGPAVPVPAAPAAPVPPADGGDTEDGLPRRVRQANLVPQLRRPTGAPPVEPDVAPLRSPEQIRSIMSALQSGTTRGRIDAARYLPGPDGDGDTPDGDGEAPDEAATDGGHAAGASFAEAATVSFPAVVDLAPTRDQESPGAGDPGRTDLTRPEKDA
jgi:hypothetical protein